MKSKKPLFGEISEIQFSPGTDENIKVAFSQWVGDWNKKVRGNNGRAVDGKKVNDKRRKWFRFFIAKPGTDKVGDQWTAIYFKDEFVCRVPYSYMRTRQICEKLNVLLGKEFKQ